MKLSIVIPVYNSYQYLDKCLESVCNQLNRNYEIICINDGSTDNSLKILNKYKKVFTNIKLINQENHGTGHARNIGIKIATGDYICFVDSDDYIHKTYIKELTSFLEEKNPDVVLCNHINVRNNEYEYFNFAELINQYSGLRIDEIGWFNKNQLYLNKVLTMPKWAWSYVCKRTFLIKNKILFGDAVLSEDVIFTTKILFEAEKIYFFNRYLYYYTIKENSTVSSINKYFYFDTFKMFDEIIRYFKNKNYFYKNKLKYELNNFFTDILYRHYDRVPLNFRKTYKYDAYKYITHENYIKFLKNIDEDHSTLANFFCIKVTKYGSHEYAYINICGKTILIPKNNISHIYIAIYKTLKFFLKNLK